MQTINNKIRQLEAEDYPDFFAYLNAQLAENGKNGMPLFQPVSRDMVIFPSDKEASFVAGLSKNVGQSGWRKAWIAEFGDGEIMGHVDLRGLSEPNTAHRALLGMGVGGAYRRRGLGRQLVGFVCDWAAGSGIIEWIDIEVLSRNEPALQLYEQTGFRQLCEIGDMFRIDGRPEALVRMTKQVG